VERTLKLWGSVRQLTSLNPQNTDPFKFILYSAKIGEQVPQMGVLSLSVQ
jgi:hypothetical protein